MTREARQQRVRRALALQKFHDGLTWRDQTRGAGEVLTIAAVQIDGLVVLDQVGGLHDPFDLDLFTSVRGPRGR